MRSRTYAVLLADILESRSRSGLRRLLGEKLSQASRRHRQKGWIRLPYSVTAGDEFQTVTDRLEFLPELLLDLRRTLRPLSIRAGVGFGRISDPLQAPVNRLGGEAFQFARSAMESLKANQLFRFPVLTGFQSPRPEFDATANLIYGLHDTLVQKITAKQWRAIDAFHDKPALEDAAKRLHVDVSTISRSLKRGYYWQLLETVAGVASLIKSTFP